MVDRRNFSDQVAGPRDCSVALQLTEAFQARAPPDGRARGALLPAAAARPRGPGLLEGYAATYGGQSQRAA